MVSIVVVCWNALEYTKVTLESLFNTVKSSYNLIIIDNGSNDDTRFFLDSIILPNNINKSEIIHNNINLGIGAAYNQGYNIAKTLNSKYTVFCNNDLLFSKGWLEKLVELMEHDSNIAMANSIRPSANDIHPQGISTIDKLKEIAYFDINSEIEAFTGFNIDEFDIFCDNICRVNKNISGDVREVKFPDSLSSCLCIVRNSSLRKYGYFADISFGNKYGGEDIDMCWSLMKDGYKCVVDNSCYIHHFRGKSMASNSSDVKKSLAESNLFLYNKWKDDIDDYIYRNNISILNLESHGEQWLIYNIFNNLK